MKNFKYTFLDIPRVIMEVFADQVVFIFILSPPACWLLYINGYYLASVIIAVMFFTIIAFDERIVFKFRMWLRTLLIGKSINLVDSKEYKNIEEQLDDLWRVTSALRGRIESLERMTKAIDNALRATMKLLIENPIPEIKKSKPKAKKRARKK